MNHRKCKQIWCKRVFASKIGSTKSLSNSNVHWRETLLWPVLGPRPRRRLLELLLLPMRRKPCQTHTEKGCLIRSTHICTQSRSSQPNRVNYLQSTCRNTAEMSQQHDWMTQQCLRWLDYRHLRVCDAICHEEQSRLEDLLIQITRNFQFTP